MLPHMSPTEFFINIICNPCRLCYIEKFDVPAVQTSDSENVYACDIAVVGFGEVQSLMFAERAYTTAVMTREVIPLLLR